MKSKLVSLAKRGWVFPVIGALVFSITAGVVLAATVFNFHGTATVVPSGVSGGGGGGTGLSYDFTVNSDAAGTVALTDADLALGNVLRGAVINKSVYLKKTGTATTFNVAVTAPNASTGLTVGVPAAPVALAASVVEVPLTFTFAADAPFAPATFDLNFALAP